MQVAISDKARELVRHVKECEARLAVIFREPFENYDPKAQLAWRGRMVSEQKVWRSLWSQV